MTLRVAAALALVLGLGAFGLFLTVMGVGPLASPDAHYLRQMKNRTGYPKTLEPITLPEFAALPRRRPVSETIDIEARGVSLEGYVQNLLRAGDGDLHMEVAAVPRLNSNSDTAYVTAEITPQWSRTHPHWTYQDLAPVMRPIDGGPSPWPGGTRRVRVSGWLLYDFQHDKPFEHHHEGHAAPRLTGWEIHPVTRIEAWDDSLKKFVDVAS